MTFPEVIVIDECQLGIMYILTTEIAYILAAD